MDDKRLLQVCEIADGLLTDVSPAYITTKKITDFKIQNLGKIIFMGSYLI